MPRAGCQRRNPPKQDRRMVGVLNSTAQQPRERVQARPRSGNRVTRPDTREVVRSRSPTASRKPAPPGTISLCAGSQDSSSVLQQRAGCPQPACQLTCDTSAPATSAPPVTEAQPTAAKRPRSVGWASPQARDGSPADRPLVIHGMGMDEHHIAPLQELDRLYRSLIGDAAQHPFEDQLRAEVLRHEVINRCERLGKLLASFPGYLAGGGRTSSETLQQFAISATSNSEGDSGRSGTPLSAAMESPEVLSTPPVIPP